jgi:hypothetical protein
VGTETKGPAMQPTKEQSNSDPMTNKSGATFSAAVQILTLVELVFVMIVAS